MKRSALLLAFLLALLPAGCVTRRVLITSNPPGAIVFRNGQPIGATPVEESFVYYGKYHYRLVREGCEPVDFYPQLEAPWYQYPGIDFVAENVVPFQIRDRKTLHFDLPEARPVRHDAIRARAGELQQIGAGLAPPPGAQPGPRATRAVTPPAGPSPGAP
ncbi:MAG: PEGA domain-containing protein [Gemmataceae bacterium]